MSDDRDGTPVSGTIHGTVLGAPFAFPPGQTLKVNSILVPPQPEDGVMLIKPDNLINGPVLALWCTGDGTGHQRGSAFLVAPGVAVTAHHVIQDYEDKEGLLRADAELVAFGQQGGLGLTWIVRSIVTPEAGDVALLMMDLHTALPEDFSLYVFELGARLPRVGERGTVLGIRSNLPDGVNVLDDRSRHLGKLEAATIASSGPIIDLYPLGRPMIDTPCFSLEATALGGMSGGPVFDARGLVIGMISSSVAIEGGYVSTASLLWQSLWFEIGPTWPSGFLGEKFRLRDVMFPPEADYVRTEGDGLVYVDRPD